MTETAVFEEMKTQLARKTNKGRVVIIGAGAVGATYAFKLMNSGLVSEISIIDITKSALKER